MAERESCVQSAITCVEGILLLLSLIALDRAMPWIGCPHSFGQSTYIEAVIGLCDVIGNSPNTFSASHYKKKPFLLSFFQERKEILEGALLSVLSWSKWTRSLPVNLMAKKEEENALCVPDFFPPWLCGLWVFFCIKKKEELFPREEEEMCCSCPKMVTKRHR